MSHCDVYSVQISCYMRDAEAIRSRGFLTGYNESVWVVILLQAAGGLVSVSTVLYSVSRGGSMYTAIVHVQYLCLRCDYV